MSCTSRNSLLLLQDDVFLNQVVDITHYLFNINIYFNCLLFREIVLLWYQLSFGHLNLPFQLLIILILLFQLQNKLLKSNLRWSKATEFIRVIHFLDHVVLKWAGILSTVTCCLLNRRLVLSLIHAVDRLLNGQEVEPDRISLGEF